MSAPAPRSSHFDFDDWARLAVLDPAGFERERARTIDAVIARAPAHRQARLRGLQWRIDHMRRHAGTPLAACLELSRMMWESVLGEDGLLDALQGHAPTAHSGGARILPFRRRSAAVGLADTDSST